MLDKAKYVNHLGETINFGTDGVLISESELHDYEWDYDTNFDEITNFRKGVVTKQFAVIICAKTPEEGIEKRNEIFEIFDRDIITQNAGKMYIGDYYCKGYVTISKKSSWFYSGRYLVNKVTFASDNPDWIKETVYTFKEEEEEEEEGTRGVKRYDYKYGYFYSNLLSTGVMENTAVSGSDFVIRVYGAVTNPLIQINEHSYQVNVSLSEGERLEINSESKSVNVINSANMVNNVFWLANKTSYIFEPIPKGFINIAWNGKFTFDLVLIDKRSEPLWT